MEYQLSPRRTRLRGTNGCFLYIDLSDEGRPRSEDGFPLLPLASIREIRLKCYGSWVPPQFHLSSFPSLEILAVDGHAMGDCFDDEYIPSLTRLLGGSNVPSLFPVLPDPASSPPLKTLAFLDCAITEDFTVKLARVALDRRNHTSTSLRRVVIMNSKGGFISKRGTNLFSHQPNSCGSPTVNDTSTYINFRPTVMYWSLGRPNNFLCRVR